ncbi:protein FAR1-RELATED SEQUENCE 5-like [Lycium barbarum]|uniref:protein FAR1-RELATED SEQUENCE 5-like n=1 Tax=Lycium barbarum TaxID=112863 RepID=UPI00293EAF70|nr:protein FAR1-RELATED SEQUENCE 5-like [Lycium barbarum]
MCETTPEEILQGNSHGLVDYEPKLGLEFDSDENPLNFYNEYARRVGFSVRREYLNTNKKLGYVTSRKITCYEGFRRNDKQKEQVKKSRRETRTGCQAHIIVTRQSTGKYRITKVELEHNHSLVPPTMVHMLPSHRKINEVQAHEIDLAEDAVLFSKATFDFMSLQAGGRVNLGYTKLDQKNYLGTKRQKAMRQGEAGVLLECFEKKRIDDPSFFSAADSKMIIDYEIFGDVLSFDTTYQTNREHRPLASFVGLNNHRKMVVFVGALMYDETSESFQWLFETFFKAMSGKKPITIFTDQDAAISKAISLVMPEVHHSLRCIYVYLDEDEFINAWNSILDEYNLHENEWLQGIYALREKLFAAYEKKFFSGGMNSTQLSESLNGDLKDYLQSDYNIVQFFKHYDRAIEDKRYNELQDTCDASQRFPVLKAQVPILAHAREVSKHGHAREYFVKVTEIGHISCTCLKFESMGILCCHIIRILDMVRGVSRSPTEYILKRWTIDAKAEDIKEVDGQYIEIKDPKLITMNRYRVLCPIFVRLEANVSETDDGYKEAIACANELSSKLKEIMKVTAPSLCTSSSGKDLLEANNSKDILTQAKGLKKKDGTRRKKGPKDSVSTGTIFENSDLSASQNMTCASLSHNSVFSLSMEYPSFTQMLTEPLCFNVDAHSQRSYSVPPDQANLFESRGSQKFQDNNTL